MQKSKKKFLDKNSRFWCSQPTNKMELWGYSVEGIVGVGTFGEVKSAKDRKGNRVVVKTIDRNSVNRKFVLKEIEAGKKLKHKNVVGFIQNFEDERNDYLILDFIDGVNLFTYINERGFTPIPENDAKHLFKQLVYGLQYCHSQGVVHRDLKLENIVINKKGRIKIIDFGLCDLVEEGQFCDGWVGSPDYVAPEILLRREYHGQAADVWSLGTLLYIFLFAEIPFVREERYAQLSKYGTHPPIEWPETKNTISDTAKDLISSTLNPDPEERITLNEVASHRWLQYGIQKFIKSSVGRSSK